MGLIYILTEELARWFDITNVDLSLWIMNFGLCIVWYYNCGLWIMYCGLCDISIVDLTLVMSLSKSVAIVSLMALKWTLWNSFCDESDRFFIVWIFKCDFCDAWDIWDITMYVVRCSLWMRQLNHFSEATYMKMWHLSIIRFFRENIQICINGSLFLHHDNTTCHVLYFKYMW